MLNVSLHGRANAFLEKIMRELKSIPWLAIALSLIFLPDLLPVAWPDLKPGLLSVFFHLAGLLLLPCVFGVRIRIILLACWPVVLVAPVSVFCHLSTRQQPSEWFFLVMKETNTSEASVFVPQIIGFVLLLGFMASAYAWVLSRKTLRDVRLGPFSSTAVVICAVLIPSVKVIRSGAKQAWKEEVWRVMENYPAGTFVAAAKATSLSYQIAHRGDAGKALAVQSNAVQAPMGKREIHFLVIGETARSSSFQINGYERETTPHLAKMPGLMSFKDVVAPAPVTTISVPVLLTPSDATTSRQASTLPSVMNVFKNAGFRVYWLSTQMKHGFWDTRCSTYAHDADEAQFLSGKLALSGEPTDAAHDSELVKAAQKILERGEPKVLIVLHTMGSHAVYSDRYPPEFNRFPSDPATCTKARNDLLQSTLTPEHDVHLRNAYDNSILYTDFVINQFIGLLGEQNAVSSLYYVSDHGENGGDAAVMPFAHGTLTTDVLRVPLIVWLSQEYRALRPAKAEALHAHVETPFSTDTTFHTLIDLAGLSCNFFKPDHSVASKNFQPGARLVTALDGTLADFDKQIVPAESKRKGWHPITIRGENEKGVVQN